MSQINLKISSSSSSLSTTLPAPIAKPNPFLSELFNHPLGVTANIRKRRSYFELKREQKRKNKVNIKAHLEQFNVYLKSMGLELDVIKIKPTENGYIRRFLLSIERDQLPDEFLLYKSLKWKDSFNISDVVYHNLVKTLNLHLPKIDSIRSLRKRLDTMHPTFENFYGYYIKVEAKLKSIIENMIKTKIIEESNQVIKIKLCGDGTNCGKFKKILNFNFSVLNESICKSAKGHYTIGVFEITNENYKELSICLKEIVSELREIKELEINGKIYKIAIYVGGDLKFLANIYGINAANSLYPCLWCKCCKNEFDNLDKEWSISDPAKGARKLEEAAEVLKNDKAKKLNQGKKETKGFFQR